MATITRPIQIEEFTIALRDVQDGELYTVREQLTKSIAKLAKTNGKLNKLLQGEALDSDDDEFQEVGHEDKSLFEEIIAENEIVARNQEQRIEKVEDELSHRGLSKAKDGSVGSVSDEKSTGVKKNIVHGKAVFDTDNTGDGGNSIFI